MNEIKENIEDDRIGDTKLEIKDNLNMGINSDTNNEEENDKKVSEETSIMTDNKSKSLDNENTSINNKDSSSPLIEDNLYLNNKLKDDHYILIEHTKFLKIPYFTFGFTTHFYFPSEKLQTKMKLSEIPNPPFTLGPDCKFIYIINKI
jgi:hypothetical protein